MFISEIRANPGSAKWVYLIWGITILRGLDGYLYANGKYGKTSSDRHLLRLTIFTTLGGIGWGLIVWNYFHMLSLQHQVYLLLIMVGVSAFATTTLSYNLRIIIPFMLAVLIPFEIRLLQEGTSFHTGLALLMLFYFVFQLAGTVRINKKYLQKIRAQIEFRLKEKEYKNLQYAINQHGIHSITDVQGNITYANDQLLKVSKFSEAELLGSNYRIMQSGEHPARFWKTMWETVVAGNVWRHKVKNKARDGSYFWLDTTIVPFMNNEGYPYQYISISTDITKLKELELQSTHEKNDALIRAKVAHILQKQKSLKERMSEALDFLGQRLESHPQCGQGILLLSEKHHTLKMYLSCGEHQPSLQDNQHCINKLLSLCKMSIVSREVTLLNSCNNTLPDPNTREDASDRGYYIIPMMHHHKVLGILFISTQPYPSTEATRLSTLKHIGNLLGMAIINEQVKINLEKGRRYAEEVAKTKSDFLANMSHEIRTPMNGVLGMLGLLQDMPLDEQAHSYVETAHSSANMLLNVINDILDISKIESGKLHIEAINFNLRKALEDTTDLLSNLALQNNNELLCYIPPETRTYVKGDMLRLQQVVNNLLSNAIKFTKNGEVSLTVSTVKASAERATLRFEVKDTGIGIPKDKQQSLFQAFTQADTSTSREYGGTGLGLTISKNLVEMMGGEIGLESEVGKGSTFWFEITFETLDQEKSENHTLDDVNILIIDDNKTNCLILENYLKAQGANCAVATDKASGLALLEENTQSFDVLLLDLQLPGKSGEQIAAHIRQNPHHAGLKIILLSSIGLDKAMNPKGHYDLMLNKPVRQAFLYDAITTVLNHKSTAHSPTHSEQNTTQTLCGRILLVDDSRVNQYVGKETLSRLGLDFDIATNGEEALAARKAKDYDVILMDCQMPVMDGFEATRQIRQYEQQAGKTGEQQAVIVALTANAMQGDRDKCVAAGMNDYLSKPYTQQTLYEMLARYLPDNTDNQVVTARLCDAELLEDVL